MINLSELRVFVTAAEELNFSRAAQRLNLSQSAVSQNIQALERTYGVELFLRHGRSVQLSEMGNTILPMARNILQATRILEDALVNARGEISGTLSIGCAATCGRYFTPNLLASFQEQYPHVRTRVTPTDRARVIEGVLTQTFDLGIVVRRPEHRELESLLLFEDRIVLIVPPDHPWSGRLRVRPQELLGQPFISRESGSDTCQTLFHELRQHGIEPENLNVVTELGDAEAVEMAVERGIGITFISEVMVARSLALGRVRQVEVEGFDLAQQIYLLRRKAEAFTRAEIRFWEFVQQQREQLAAELLQNLTNVTSG